MYNKEEKSKKKKGKSLFRKVVEWLHLWLGLVSGILVVIISVTGCLFVFQQEVNNWYYHKTLYVTPEQRPVLPLSQLLDKAQAALGPGKPASYITTYTAPDKAWEFSCYSGNDTAITYFGAIKYYEAVYVNPYTGEVTGRIDFKRNFFSIVKYIHWSLLLNTKYGQPIVGWSTFIFVILLVTGLIMWWPKKWTRSTRQQSFKIKWKASFKRLNYDLHNVLGFYALIIALVIALTGMVWSFTWFEAAVYVAASGSTQPPAIKTVQSVKNNNEVADIDPLDIAYNKAAGILKSARRIGVTPAATPDGVHYISGYKGKEVYYGRDELQFDQYSGALLNRRNDNDKNRGERLLDMNYDIHVGAIGGLPGKIIAFVISLICASLPITGFYIWWGKKKKSKKPVKQAVRVAVSS